MESAPLNDAKLFHDFLAQHVAVGTSQSPDELLHQWRSQQEEFDDAVDAIREGLADLAAGRVRPWEEFDREFRERHNIPTKGE